MTEDTQKTIARLMAYSFTQAAMGPWAPHELPLALALCQVALQWADRSGHTQNIDTCVHNLARVRAAIRSIGS